jgi:hypothetical protein
VALCNDDSKMNLKAESKEREQQVRWEMPRKSIAAPMAEVVMTPVRIVRIGSLQTFAGQRAAAGMATGRAAAARAVGNLVASCSRAENEDG